jgi:hypothetical protein
MGSDEEFIAAFEQGRIAPADFHHHEHLRLAWLYLRRDGLAAAQDQVRAGIRAFARAAGKPELYHETLTLAWLALLDIGLRGARAAGREPATFAQFLATQADLQDKQRVARHYRPETLASAQARATWVPPDLVPFE